LDYWAKALITSGNRRRNKNIKLVSLPKSEETGKWSKKYSAKIKGAQKAVNLYKKTRKRIEKDMRLADRGRYVLSYLNQLNNLQIYPSKLLLKLNAYDTAMGKEKLKKMTQVLKYVNHFKKIRNQFEKVFSRTRFLNKPKGYQLDQNYHHHWTNTTLNSDWM